MAVARSSSGDVEVCYVLPVLWMTLFAHNGPYEGMSTPLLRVTLLHRRGQHNAPLALNWLRCVLVKIRGAGRTDSCFAQYPCTTVGDAENAGLENAGLENVGPNRRGGKRGTGKRGNIMCMGSEM